MRTAGSWAREEIGPKRIIRKYKTNSLFMLNKVISTIDKKQLNQSEDLQTPQQHQHVDENFSTAGRPA